MKLKTLGETTWDKIKIGEVFAEDGCWNILAKMSDTGAILLADDFSDYPAFGSGEECIIYGSGRVYKLPLSAQRLWKCDK